jgi:hypothetical protein
MDTQNGKAPVMLESLSLRGQLLVDAEIKVRYSFLQAYYSLSRCAKKKLYTPLQPEVPHHSETKNKCTSCTLKSIVVTFTGFCFHRILCKHFNLGRTKLFTKYINFNPLIGARQEVQDLVGALISHESTHFVRPGLTRSLSSFSLRKIFIYK